MILQPKKLRSNKQLNKVAGYKISTQKSVAFLYTTNNLQNKSGKTIPFTMASKKLKYLEINLMKEVTNLYNENYKSLKEEINKDIRR
jgi:hypothetical protein